MARESAGTGPPRKHSVRAHAPSLVAINLTRRCNLDCSHCYMDAVQRRVATDDELSTEELSALLVRLGDEGEGSIVVLTGGEPLMRRDLEELVEVGTKAGLRVVVGTNGVLLNPERASRLKEKGLVGVGVSLDSATKEHHDQFRGSEGSFEKSCAGIRAAVAAGLHAQVHMTITRDNLDELRECVDLSVSLGASIVNFFFLVCIGRGDGVMDLSPDQYESVLNEIVALQAEVADSGKGVMVQARCAPHFKRVLFENDPNSAFTRAQGYDGGGCIAGTSYCRVTPTGDVTACPYIEASAGNIRETDFWSIWDNAAMFHSLRHGRLSGRCGGCEYTAICGGCRARGLLSGGDLMGEDPSCAYQPKGGAMISILDPNNEGCAKVVWTEGARRRLKTLPFFLRSYVKRRLEERAAREGTVVSEELMSRHRREREQELGTRFS